MLYRHEGQYHVASRGSFHSSGALWATSFIRSRDLACLPDEVTLCFEIIHPEHKIILNYEGQETLIILAAFNRHTGIEYPRTVVADWARALSLPLVPLLGHMSLEELLHTQQRREQFEGFVLRFGDGRRVKVKTDWYMKMAKIVSNLTPIAVWEVMIRGKVPQEYVGQAALHVLRRFCVMQPRQGLVTSLGTASLGAAAARRAFQSTGNAWTTTPWIAVATNQSATMPHVPQTCVV